MPAAAREAAPGRGESIRMTDSWRSAAARAVVSPAMPPPRTSRSASVLMQALRVLRPRVACAQSHSRARRVPGRAGRALKPGLLDARTRRQTSSGDRTMLRTIFMIGLFAIGGLFLLRIAFGLFGFALGLFGVLFWLAIKVVIIGGLIYLAIRIFSPDTARRLRQKWSGSSY